MRPSVQKGFYEYKYKLEVKDMNSNLKLDDLYIRRPCRGTHPHPNSVEAFGTGLLCIKI
jgi:hypothetical protein